MAEARPCTCHPDERPWPCARRYAFGECKATPFWRRVLAAMLARVTS